MVTSSHSSVYVEQDQYHFYLYILFCISGSCKLHILKLRFCIQEECGGLFVLYNILNSNGSDEYRKKFRFERRKAGYQYLPGVGISIPGFRFAVRHMRFLARRAVFSNRISRA